MAACYSCSIQFSFLKKQKICEACKLSFCKNCLTQNLLIDGMSKSVCQQCHKRVTEKRNLHELDPPALFIKRLANENNLSKPSEKMERKLESLKRGLSGRDLEIAHRLERLMEDDKSNRPVTSEEETRRRLNALQGIEASTSTSTKPTKAPYQPPSTATESEQADALLSQYMDEMQIKDEMNIDEESDDENSAVAKVMERAMAEAALPPVEKRSGGITPPDWEPEDVSIGIEELPWCEICNNDANMRCLTCDNALYCNRCLRETHDSFDLKDHKVVSFHKQ